MGAIVAMLVAESEGADKKAVLAQVHLNEVVLHTWRTHTVIHFCSESHRCLPCPSPLEEEHTGLGLSLHNPIFGRNSKQTDLAFADGGAF